MHNGVVETATGDLLRDGYCNFVNDGGFDAANETQIASPPVPTKIRGDEDETMMHRWTVALGWHEVAQPV